MLQNGGQLRDALALCNNVCERGNCGRGGNSSAGKRGSLDGPRSNSQTSPPAPQRAAHKIFPPLFFGWLASRPEDWRTGCLERAAAIITRGLRPCIASKCPLRGVAGHRVLVIGALMFLPKISDDGMWFAGIIDSLGDLEGRAMNTMLGGGVWFFVALGSCGLFLRI